MRLYEFTESNLNEGTYKFSGKTGKMEYDNSDPDQRHGIYIDGKLKQAFSTKDEADNVVRRDRRFANGIVKKIVSN